MCLTIHRTGFKMLSSNNDGRHCSMLIFCLPCTSCTAVERFITFEKKSLSYSLHFELSEWERDNLSSMFGGREKKKLNAAKNYILFAVFLTLFASTLLLLLSARCAVLIFIFFSYFDALSWVKFKNISSMIKVTHLKKFNNHT